MTGETNVNCDIGLRGVATIPVRKNDEIAKSRLKYFPLFSPQFPDREIVTVRRKNLANPGQAATFTCKMNVFRPHAGGKGGFGGAAFSPCT